jgi:hypothetical protein
LGQPLQARSTPASRSRTAVRHTGHASGKRPGVPRFIDFPIIFDDFSAISPQWPLDRVSADIFVTA